LKEKARVHVLNEPESEQTHFSLNAIKPAASLSTQARS
jgi:hypothetical protein